MDALERYIAACEAETERRTCPFPLRPTALMCGVFAWLGRPLT